MNRIKLIDLTIDNKGHYGLGASASPFNINYPLYLRITDIDDNSYVGNLPTCVNPNEYIDYKNYILNNNDIVFARTGNSTGRNYFYDGKFKNVVFAGFLIKYALDQNKVVPKYVSYYCQSQKYKATIDSLSNGSTRKNLNANQFGEIEIPMYSSDMQQHIVNTIGTLDDLIESLLKQNDKINMLIQEILQKTTLNIDRIKIEFLSGYSIIKSGISNFNGNKIYLDTASVNKTIIESTDYFISQNNKPSRANMQPIPNSIWFAKLKDSPKYLFVLDYMTDILNDYIFSTGFLGLKTINSKIANYFYALITSTDFDEQKNRLSIGATMQGINNDSFKEILVPNLPIETMEQIGSQIEIFTKTIYINNRKISNLKKQKEQYLKKFFG